MGIFRVGAAQREEGCDIMEAAVACETQPPETAGIEIICTHPCTAWLMKAADSCPSLATDFSMSEEEIEGLRGLNVACGGPFTGQNFYLNVSVWCTLWLLEIITMLITPSL